MKMKKTYLVGIDAFSTGVGSDYPNAYQFPVLVTSDLAKAEKTYRELASKDRSGDGGYEQAYLAEVPEDKLFSQSDIKYIHGE